MNDTGMATAPAPRPAIDHCEIRREPVLCQEDRAVCAEPDERLLADRNQPAVSRERIPHHRQDHEREQHRQLLIDIRAEEERHNGEHRDDEQRDRHERHRDARPPLHAESAGKRCGVGPDHSCTPASQEPDAWRGEHRQKYQVSEQDRVLGVDLLADHLGDAEHDATAERSPRRAEPADDHSLECEDELRWSRRGIERGTDREKHTAKRRCRNSDRSGPGVDGSRVDADEFGCVRILCGGAHLTPRIGAGEEQLQSGEDHDRSGKDERAERGDGETTAHVHACRRQRSGTAQQRVHVGREHLEQDVLDDDRQAERGQQRHEESGSPAAFQQQHVHRVADDPHARDHDERSEKRGD